MTMGGPPWYTISQQARNVKQRMIGLRNQEGFDTKPLQFDYKFITEPEYKPFGTPYIVYGWGRGSEFLYIGMSTQGVNRFRSHQYIKRHKIRKTDKFYIWLCSDKTEALRIESLLIKTFEPIFNRESDKL